MLQRRKAQLFCGDQGFSTIGDFYKKLKYGSFDKEQKIILQETFHSSTELSLSILWLLTLEKWMLSRKFSPEKADNFGRDTIMASSARMSNIHGWWGYTRYREQDLAGARSRSARCRDYRRRDTGSQRPKRGGQIGSWISQVRTQQFQLEHGLTTLNCTAVRVVIASLTKFRKLTYLSLDDSSLGQATASENCFSSVSNVGYYFICSFVYVVTQEWHLLTRVPARL